MKEKLKNLDPERVTNYILIFLCIALFVMGRFYNLNRVVGRSMEPTYHSGNLLLSKKRPLDDELVYGSVIVAIEPDETRELIIKRVEGLPGDRVRIADGKLYVNDKVRDEGLAYINDAGLLEDEITLGEDEYIILGDNRNNSRDSRIFGPVKKEDITNIILFRIF